MNFLCDWLIGSSPIFVRDVSFQENSREKTCVTYEIPRVICLVFLPLWLLLHPLCKPLGFGDSEVLPHFISRALPPLGVFPWWFGWCFIFTTLQTWSHFSMYSRSLFSLSLRSFLFPKIIGCLWTAVSISNLAMATLPLNNSVDVSVCWRWTGRKWRASECPISVHLSHRGAPSLFCFFPALVTSVCLLSSSLGKY